MSIASFPLRYVARVLVQTTTPLAIGTGTPGLNTDELVSVDVNGLPMLPGTSLCGVLRSHSKPVLDVDDIFGFQKKGSNEGSGSRLIISDGLMSGKNGEVHDGLSIIDWDDNFYRKFRALPVRDHCRINQFGTADAENNGKYDEQVVYKGTRFVFEMELIGSADDSDTWERLLHLIYSPLFRVGGGTRKGFGGFSVISLETRIYNLAGKSDLGDYLQRSSSLRSSFPGCKPFGPPDKRLDDSFITFELNLVPEDFFYFGSGFSDSDADNTYKQEEVIEWETSSGSPEFSKEMVLIPASSVKGALSHRTAFYYNYLKGIYACHEELDNYKVDENAAVRALFGYAKDDTSENREDGQRGIVILDDTFLTLKEEKIFNHVSIDRFLIPGKEYDLLEEQVKTAFKMALRDIATGMLPLGGAVMKGHGCFTGSIACNGGGLQ
jgi:CRISPR/Cas system CSM-associated protein Csm3 (group 7 of RAMP superfamily)